MADTIEHTELRVGKNLRRSLCDFNRCIPIIATPNHVDRLVERGQFFLITLVDDFHENGTHHAARRSIVIGTTGLTDSLHAIIRDQPETVQPADDSVAERRSSALGSPQQRDTREDKRTHFIRISSSKTDRDSPPKRMPDYHGRTIELPESRPNHLRVFPGPSDNRGGGAGTETRQIEGQARHITEGFGEVRPPSAPAVECQNHRIAFTEHLGKQFTLSNRTQSQQKNPRSNRATRRE